MIDRRAHLVRTAQALRVLHKSLIDHLQASWERDHGRVPSSAELLRLLMSEPHFEWLRPMSRLMVELDDVLEGPPDVQEDGREMAVRDRLRALLAGDGGEFREFGEHYMEALQADPDVVLAHAALRKTL